MSENVELKEIINQIRGVSYGKKDVSDTKTDGYVPVLRSNNIQDSKIDLSDLVYVKPEKVKPIQFLKKGDILITASTGSLKVIGKNAQCKDDLNASFGAFCKVVRVKNADHSYLGHLFQSPQYFSYIQNIVNGANINNIKNEHIDNFKIPLPNLKTQQRIAQTLDTAAALRDKTAQLLEEYNLLAQSIFLEMFGDPVVNPMGWEKVSFKKLFQQGKKSIKPEDIAEGQKYVGLEHIEKETGDILEVVELAENELKSNKFWFNEEYVLYGKLRPYLNKVASPNFEGICSTDIIPFKPIENKSNKSFLIYLMKGKWFVNYANERTSGANLPRVSPKDILKFQTINPPIKLQTHFAQKIANIEAQKALARQELQESQDLFNCLLQKAFKGQLQ